MRAPAGSASRPGALKGLVPANSSCALTAHVTVVASKVLTRCLAAWQELPEDAPVLVLLPGLTGGSHDTYVQHMVSRAREAGFRCAPHEACASSLPPASRLPSVPPASPASGPSQAFPWRLCCSRPPSPCLRGPASLQEVRAPVYSWRASRPASAFR